jgi:hypothetical protein
MIEPPIDELAGPHRVGRMLTSIYSHYGRGGRTVRPARDDVSYCVGAGSVGRRDGAIPDSKAPPDGKSL